MHDKQKQALKQLEDDRGRLEPVDVVDAARDPASPLHDSFNWNIHEAAEAHWVTTARSLIRSYRLEVTVHETTRKVSVRAYERDPTSDKDESRYKSIDKIKESREEQRLVLLSRTKQSLSHVSSCMNTAEYFGWPLSDLRVADAALKSFAEMLEDEAPHTGTRRESDPPPAQPQAPT